MKIIESYIKYLKNISRKIISKVGFENVLPSETKKKNNLFYNLNEFKVSFCNSKELQITKLDKDFFSYLQKCEYFLNISSESKLFIGLGLINGINKKHGKQSIISAPLLYALADLEKNDDDSYSLFIDIDSYQLNYDLFAKMFDISVDEEFEREIMSQEDFLKFQVLSKIESNYIDITQNNLDVNKNNIIDYIDIFYELKNSINEFSNVSISNEEFLYDTRINKIKDDQSQLKFYDIIFSFVNKVPNELSTFEALNILSKQKPLENKLLNKIFENTLSDNKISFSDANDLEEEKIHSIVKNFLPMDLSKNQIEALLKAWTNEIIYIEGPPGTGKSHTIAALMLSAIFLNKSVLLVSQKKAAIDVVKEKVDSLLGKESVLYIGSEDKSYTKHHIDLLLAATPSKRYSMFKKDRFDELNSKNEKFISNLKTLNKTISSCYEDYKSHLENENTFYILFQKFLAMREEFINTYKPIEFNTYSFSKSKINYSNYEKAIYKFKKLTKTKNIKKIDLYYIIKFLQNINKNFNADLEKSKNNPYYIDDIVKLNYYFSQSFEVLTSLNKKIAQDLKEKILISEKSKEKLIKENLYNYFYNQKLKNIISEDNDLIKDAIQIFRGMLHFKNPQIVSEKMKKLDFTELIKVFPLWCSELRNLGNTLPMEPELFDMVIVDEASQVNIAEIMPAFYRGKQFCIVGDEKQLHINATGVGFAVSKSFDRLIWNSEMGRIKEKNKPIIDFDKAKLKKLIVTESSILEFFNSNENNFYIPKVLLDEHFRSLPLLAKFNNREFYDSSLKIMTENGYNINKICFKAIKVNGLRDSNNKIVQNEIMKVFEIVDTIVFESYTKIPELKNIEFPNQSPSIGILSILTNQKNKLREILYERYSDEIITKFNIFIATPEEFQGNERDIMIIALGLDGTNSWSISHYENKNRFNVATSRAKYFTYLIFGGIPNNSNLIKRYLSHFNYNLQDSDIIYQDTCTKNIWEYNTLTMESEFELKVSEYLEKYAQKNPKVKIFNQVQACGQKRLDFVLYNTKSKVSCAIEVDGKTHFDNSEIKYTDSHLERDAILKRAGWKIINIKYYNWYDNGWLSQPSNIYFQEEIKRIYSELDNYLSLSI